MAEVEVAETVMTRRIAELRQRKATLYEMGGRDRVEKQHKQGKLSARERVDELLDGGSWQEMYGFARHRATEFGMANKEIPADAVVTGCGTIDGRLVTVASQDFTSAGGAVGEVNADKIVEMAKYSLKTGSPFIVINDSGGARIQEGIDALAGYGRVFYHNTLLSGVVPQISLVCGPCAG
ncbi:MAG TPA: carboxyl transferase domain-containing protein, partial [Rhodothermales bacterium]